MQFNKDSRSYQKIKRRPHSSKDRLSNRDVFSYHNAGTVSGSSTDRDRRNRVITTSRNNSRLNWRIWPTLLMGMTLIISIGYMLTLSSSPRIVIDDQDRALILRPIEDYNKIASSILEASILNRNKITVNAVGFSTAMRHQFPELEQADLAIPLVDRHPVIKLRFSKPVMRLTTKQSDTYFLDVNGRALLKDTQGTSDSILPIVVDESGLSVEVGKGVLTKQTIEFITTVNHQLSNSNISVENISLPPNAHRLHIKIAGKPYFIKFNTLTDAKVSSGSAIALIKKLEAEHITPSQYIDLRVEEKAYYL